MNCLESLALLVQRRLSPRTRRRPWNGIQVTFLCTLIHADKNMHQLELAGEMFKEIKQAYSILTDPQERAWYDSHRESILRGATAANGTAEDTENSDDFMSFNLWPYFSSSSYHGYGDDPEVLQSIL